jgi:hypothetical protein
MEPNIGMVLVSAGVGALAASVIPFISARSDRKARKKELLLRLSIELGIEHKQEVLRIAAKFIAGTDKKVHVQDPIINAEDYHGWLEALFEHGQLPDDPQLKRSARPGEGKG